MQTACIIGACPTRSPFADVAGDQFGQRLLGVPKRTRQRRPLQTATFLGRPAVEPLSPGLLAAFGVKSGTNGISNLSGTWLGK
jgi:hypothetical protein